MLTRVASLKVVESVSPMLSHIVSNPQIREGGAGAGKQAKFEGGIFELASGGEGEVGLPGAKVRQGQSDASVVVQFHFVCRELHPQPTAHRQRHPQVHLLLQLEIIHPLPTPPHHRLRQQHLRLPVPGSVIDDEPSLAGEALGEELQQEGVDLRPVLPKRMVQLAVGVPRFRHRVYYY